MSSPDPRLRVAVLGCGATGTRVARQLLRGEHAVEVLLADSSARTADDVARSLGSGAAAVDPGDLADIDVVVLAIRGGDHARAADRLLGRTRAIVSISDSLDDVENLLDLHRPATARGTSIVVGAGMMPGLTDVLAAHAATWFDQVDEVHVSKFGTGGPDCARQHHRALKGTGIDRREGHWVRRPGGSGRELAWFPPPVQAADCYRAALGDTELLARVHTDATRITSRMAATRRDRLTMHLPMLRRPHPEGLLGAVRVELRGVSEGGARSEVVLGCSERPAVAAGAVAAATAIHVGTHRVSAGAAGLAEVVEATAFLREIRRRGLRLEIFVGADESY